VELAYIVDKTQRKVQVLPRAELKSTSFGWVTCKCATRNRARRYLVVGRDVFYSRTKAVDVLKTYIEQQIKKCAARLARLQAVDVEMACAKEESVLVAALKFAEDRDE